MLAGWSCTSSPSPSLTFSAQAWPEADRLFHQSDRWLGADAAFSIDLGGDRVLWLFGDTFVARQSGGGRSGAFFPRNTVALQTGRDPSTATLSFYWGTAANGDPSSYFADKAPHWLWPQHGVRLEGRLLVFLQEIEADSGGLGFKAVGGTAVSIDNPDDPPSKWSPQPVPVPMHDFGSIIGASVLASADYLFAVSLVEPGGHDAFLVRWPLMAARAGSLASPEWWSGSWGAGSPTALWKSGAPELSVQQRGSTFVSIQSLGFGSTTIGALTAPALTGPWSKPVEIYRPPESDRKNVLVYAAKAHPELTGADLVVTYASNSTDLATLASDTSLYFPRFVRVSASPKPP
jgi:hypothetical protein